MAVSCVAPELAARLKEKIASKEISVEQLYNMSSQERNQAFSDATNAETGQFINAQFEKAMLSSQKDAMTKWANKVFRGSQKKGEGYKNVIDKINALDKDGILNPTTNKDFLSGLVAEKIGVAITQAEAQELSKRAKKLQDLYQKRDADGIPSEAYWVERNRMDKYLNALAPSSTLRVLTSTAGRGAMLLSVKSPLLNIESNVIHGMIQAIERRIASGKFRGLNDAYAFELQKKIIRIYSKSGYDISRMKSLYEGQRRLGEEITHSEGKGIGRAIGRFYEDLVFKRMLGSPDTFFSALAFTDALNLASTEIAKGEGLKGKEAQKRALEIMQEAASPDIESYKDKTEVKIVRERAIAEAQYATYTNDSIASNFALNIRNAINAATGDMRLGDNIMPFVKTPANVVQAGLEGSFFATPFWVYRAFPAISELINGNTGPIKNVVRSAVRNGVGATLATIIAFAFDPEDFVGDYDSMSQKERDLVKAKNATYNSIRIGDRYVSLDYLGPLASHFVGIMYARKYGGDSMLDRESIWQYYKGAGMQILKLPGLSEGYDLVKDVRNKARNGDFGDVSEGVTNSMIGFIGARTIPGIVRDIAKGMDPVQRTTDRTALSQAQAGVPGLREELPVKVSPTTGKAKKGEGMLSQILFGSRVKTAEDSKLLDEIQRLADAGEAPSISDVSYSSQRFKDLKEQIPLKKFQAAVNVFNKRYASKAKMQIRKADYKRKSDYKKKNMLNKVRREAMDYVLDRYKYKKPRKR
jgi:hypothetical protein